MANLIKDIEYELMENEIVESGVIGEMGWGEYGSDHVPNYDKMPKGKVISWSEMKKWLDYEFSSGYGAPECNAIYVWTNIRVFFISQYDGSTSLESVPRYPVDTMPSMPGG